MDVPERPCAPDRPAAFETVNKVSGLTGGPNIQFTYDWATIAGDAAKRGAGMGAPLLSSVGDATQSSWLMASTNTLASTAQDKATAIQYA